MNHSISLQEVVSCPDHTPLARRRVWWLMSNFLVVLSQQYRFGQANEISSRHLSMWWRSQKSLWTSALTSLYTGVCHSSVHWCRNIWTAKITQWGTALELMLPPSWTLPCALLRSHMTNIITADLAQPRSRSLVTRSFSPWGGCGLGTRLHQGGCSYPLKNYDFNWHNIFFACAPRRSLSNDMYIIRSLN